MIISTILSREHYHFQTLYAVSVIVNGKFVLFCFPTVFPLRIYKTKRFCKMIIADWTSSTFGGGKKNADRLISSNKKETK